MGSFSWLGEARRWLCRRTAEERRVLVWAVICLPWIGLGLRAWGLGCVQRALSRLSHVLAPRQPVGDPLQWSRSAGRMVAAAAGHGFLPASCLARALCLWTLMRRQGLDGQLRIGVAKPDGSFCAHAWVELAGQVVNDSPDVIQQFPPFDRNIDLSGAVR